MPIMDTKYNKMPMIYQDITEQSFKTIDLFGRGEIYLRDINKVLTCKKEDIYYIENQVINFIKLYVNSKANFLIHPFTICRNVTDKFNNEKEIYRYKKQITNKECIPISKIQIQKDIQKQIKVPASLYTMNKSALAINSNNLNNSNKNWNNMSDRKLKHGKINQIKSSIKVNSGVDIKHNSYARHLGKLKSNNLKTENVNNLIIPLKGNKNRKFGISNCMSNC